MVSVCVTMVSDGCSRGKLLPRGRPQPASAAMGKRDPAEPSTGAVEDPGGHGPRFGRSIDRMRLTLGHFRNQLSECTISETYVGLVTLAGAAWPPARSFSARTYPDLPQNVAIVGRSIAATRAESGMSSGILFLGATHMLPVQRPVPCRPAIGLRTLMAGCMGAPPARPAWVAPAKAPSQPIRA